MQPSAGIGLDHLVEGTCGAAGEGWWERSRVVSLPSAKPMIVRAVPPMAWR